MILPIADAVVVPQMEGVTTAIVLFLFACLAMPHLIKNRTQYYVALWCAIGIIGVSTLRTMIPSAGFIVFGGFVIGVLQITAVLMLVLCVGGMTMQSMAGEMKGAYEVIRRGEQEKEVIIPLTGQKPKPRDREDDETPVININSPPPAPPPSSPPPDHNSSIPME